VPGVQRVQDGITAVAGPDALVLRAAAACYSTPRPQAQEPEAVLSDKIRAMQLAEALGQLTPDHREVIVLRNLQRLPFDEVAQRMDRSRPAVQMLWMRAIEKLQEVMGAV